MSQKLSDITGPHKNTGISIHVNSMTLGITGRHTWVTPLGPIIINNQKGHIFTQSSVWRHHDTGRVYMETDNHGEVTRFTWDPADLPETRAAFETGTLNVEQCMAEHKRLTAFTPLDT